MTATGKLREISSDMIRYLRGERCVHLFLLTSQVDDGPVGLLPEVFMRQMMIHIICTRPVFLPRKEMESSGWYFPWSTSSPRPNKDSHGERIPLRDWINSKNGVVSW